MITPFLVEGLDGTTPLQAYCSVMTSDFMFVDSIYPHPDISICVRLIDADNQFGNNAYTRKTVIDELIKLDRAFICVKHYYHRYKTVLQTHDKIEAMEYDCFNDMRFDSVEDRYAYILQMHKRMKNIFIRCLQQAIPEVSISDNPDMVIQPYLLTQIFHTLDINTEK